MSTTNRSARITKLFSLLKKRYKPLPPSAGRNLFEHFLYACLLENGSQEAADEGIARLEQDYFDWNEVRVTTVSELAESFPRLPNANEAASRLKKNLHALFETYYSFDIEEMKKQNLGKTIKDLSEFPAMTSFVLAYIVQQGLGGHAIPINAVGIDICYYCGIVNDAERETSKVPGIERAIPKAKGTEFSSLLHQAALDLASNPQDPELHKLILQVNPDAADLLPGKKVAPASPSKSSSNKSGANKAAADKSTDKTAATKAAASKSAAVKKPAKKSTAPVPSDKAPLKGIAASIKAKKAATQSTPPAKAAPKKGASKSKSTKDSEQKGDSTAAAKPARSATKKLTKKKPR
ncbi:hypothetical protein Poly24_03700 [Rosistilla carotiformis]|uniref:Uncharacterized protein n=1 Tax=Rosistilla carotiformis TaxID=2528017 RepID=A0A518JMB0_9BACT|nr:hypothetical protein [Rosistilla carotiformis]QDV66683.1 hypothetical protein Poly24_03700 [Rosistilla carotiformis]